MIRLRLTRSRTTSTRIVRLSATTPDKPPPTVVVEGELCRAHQDGEQVISLERARTFEEGINYDHAIALQLDQAADDGQPRLWLSAPVCLVVVSDEGVPVRVETDGGSEYLIMVL